MKIAMEGSQTGAPQKSLLLRYLSLIFDEEYVWGVIDFIPETDFPDVRNLCNIRSNNGSCLSIPRERDSVRFYVQLCDTDLIDPSTGRIDSRKIGPIDIFEVCCRFNSLRKLTDRTHKVVRKSIHPYKIATPDQFEWSTVYISSSLHHIAFDIC